MKTYSTLLTETFRQRVEEAKGELARTISAGSLASFDEYKRICGQVQGLDMALSLLDDVEAKTAKGSD